MKFSLLPCISAAALLWWMAGAEASADTVVIDDFTSGPIALDLADGVRFDSITQSNVLSSELTTQRHWSDVWSRPLDAGGPTASIAVDPDDGVLRIETSGDPFTYFRLGYGSDQRPLSYDVLAGGFDRLRIRFRGESAALYFNVGLTSNAELDTRGRGRILGGRFATVPGQAVVEVPFRELIEDSLYEEFVSDIDSIGISAFRFQGELEIDSIEFARPPVEGDLNRDGVFDNDDRRFWASQYNGIRTDGVALPTSSAIFVTSDLNNDGQVNAADYTLWRDLFDSTPLDGLTATPEPGAASLSALAVAIGCIRRRP